MVWLDSFSFFLIPPIFFFPQTFLGKFQVLQLLSLLILLGLSLLLLLLLFTYFMIEYYHF